MATAETNAHCERVACDKVAQNLVLVRISRLQEQLRENDIIARDDELIARGIDEFLLIREYRKRQMQKISAKVGSLLRDGSEGPKERGSAERSSDNKSRDV